MKKLFFGVVFLLALTAFKNDKPAYRLYNAKGKLVKYQKMINAAKTADVVFFGEQHNNPIAHWLELQITKDLYKARNGNIIEGAEMFERDNQLILDEYLKGEITQKYFEEEARLWPNYKTDYKPLVEFAKKHHVPFIATNVPRRYANIVYKHGFKALDTLTAEAKSYMAPLPIPYDPNVKCYKDMLAMMKQMGHSNPNLPKAQALKDATMAASIAQYAGKGKLFIHYEGAYHSDHHQGIIWYLNRYKPGLKIVTISTVEQKDIDTLNEKNKNLADFIIVVPDDMTTTY
ncbi:ChaN family lipoprotein [Candidatus Sulfidibacterium hydrothermale]|uniref:ChaN family lipoprotein n=1 Tax=Candidatus Sulfidibacterium hydrothermale TaxID=2875962 RepID=UPI001F0A682C|nr:ChaN family lipoprotein [Candidatus Sulfidibacterium hydrothermale]UBM62848.1 ChaN family lipoprotein [Candidatus Sulfidibacterium hydrothermale]